MFSLARHFSVQFQTHRPFPDRSSVLRTPRIIVYCESAYRIAGSVLNDVSERGRSSRSKRTLRADQSHYRNNVLVRLKI